MEKSSFESPLSRHPGCFVNGETRFPSRKRFATGDAIDASYGRVYVYLSVYTRVTESRDLPGPCLVRRQEADENSIELDGPPSALRRSMKADVLAETNERVSFNGPRKSRSCPPRLANPLNPLRLFRLIAHRVTPRSCDFTAEKRIASRDSDDFPWPFAASWRVACRRLIAVPLEPGYRTGETDRSDRRRIGT